LKGGGGNFGVVTEFEFRLHPVEEVLAGPTFFRPGRGVLEGFRDALAILPREFGALLGLTRTPALPFIAEEHHGQPTMALITCWAGDGDGFANVLERIGGWGEIIGQHVGPMPYPVINTLFDDLLPFGLRNYWKSLIARSIDDRAVEVHCRQVAGVPNVESGIFFHPIDGTCRDRGPADTAFPHRDATCVVGVYGTWHEAADDIENRQWVRDCYEELRPHYGDSEYVNFAPDEDPDAPRSIYGQNYERLSRIKREYDPLNLFRRNQNVGCAPG
jgi:FAD/FMN-containing dehydrogenase